MPIETLRIHALPQFLDAAAGGKAVRDSPVQHFFVLFKKNVRGDLIHTKKDVVLDHILKPVGQQAGKVNGYVLSCLGPGILPFLRQEQNSTKLIYFTRQREEGFQERIFFFRKLLK